MKRKAQAVEAVGPLTSVNMPLSLHCPKAQKAQGSLNIACTSLPCPRAIVTTTTTTTNTTTTTITTATATATATATTTTTTNY